ncbi:MAG: hypothetical protein ACOY40_13750 [Bacillota bacterium]
MQLYLKEETNGLQKELKKPPISTTGGKVLFSAGLILFGLLLGADQKQGTQEQYGYDKF